MPDDLRVMITGAGAGIGAAIASGFADDGARVTIADVDAEILQRALAGDRRLDGRAIDVTDPEAVDEWFDDTVGAWGGVDVLVNNAGIAGPTAYVEDVRVEDWRRCLAVGVESHFLTCRRAAAQMKHQASGSIINISSTAGQYGYGLRSPYAAAKWAVIGLTKSLAVELGPHSVRVNAICPGSVEGPRMRGVIVAEAAARGLAVDEVEQQYTGGQSIHRFVQPSEIADLCRFLASPASAMISGQAIAVDGHTETFRL